MTAAELTPSSSFFPRSAQQHQPPHTSRSHSTRTPTTHRDLRPITTSLPSSHRTVALPTTPSLRHRPSNPSRTHSSSSSSQSSISSASSGASESSSSESPVQATNATTSWKDWAMGRGRRETEEEEKGEVVEGLEKKEDLSGELWSDFGMSGGERNRRRNAKTHNPPRLFFFNRPHR